MTIGMGVTGGKRVRSTVGSMPNKGCIFGSMGGLPPTVGVLAINGAIYRNQTSYCNDQCIPVGCKEGFDYLRRNGLITFNGNLPEGVHHINYKLQNNTGESIYCLTLQAIN